METLVTSINEGIAYYNATCTSGPRASAMTQLSRLRCSELSGGRSRYPALRRQQALFHSPGNERQALRADARRGRATEREMLTRFFGEDYRHYFETLPCDWKAFDRAERAIAYRGGSGYAYSIWGYTA